MQGFRRRALSFSFRAGKAFQMLLPVANALSVPGDTHSLEYSVPEALHGLLLRQAGEHPPGPGGWDGGDAPGKATAHLQTVKSLQSLAAGAQGTHPAVRIHPFEMLRILGINDQIAAPRLA